MPAEWELHRATWIAWPHQESDFPGKLNAVEWVYTEIVRHLSRSEEVEILVPTEEVRERAALMLSQTGVREGFRLHLCSNDRSWVRDSGPVCVKSGTGTREWISFKFNAWAKYSNFSCDAQVPAFFSRVSGVPLTAAQRPDTGDALVLEGGAIDTDGAGTLLTTEECLLSEVQERNRGLNREGYEAAFRKYLGIEKTIWLGRSCEGDDTHGHVDDVARFVSPGRVVVAYEPDPRDPHHESSAENLRRLQEATDARGRNLEVLTLPFPSPLYFEGERLPASYANFYIANGVVIVPTFNDPKDREALEVLGKAFPTRAVIGINSTDLVLGFGTLHCLTQQEPAA
jgi:agmatine deiminase